MCGHAVPGGGSEEDEGCWQEVPQDHPHHQVGVDVSTVCVTTEHNEEPQ